jgi:hypothetical protein
LRIDFLNREEVEEEEEEEEGDIRGRPRSQ